MQAADYNSVTLMVAKADPGVLVIEALTRMIGSWYPLLMLLLLIFAGQNFSLWCRFLSPFFDPSWTD